MLENTILEDVKDYIGPMVSGDGFNKQLLLIIESNLLALDEIGCLLPIQERLTEDTTWSEVIQPPKSFRENQESYSVYSAIITYVGLKTLLQFDPPANQAIKASKEKIADEQFWRIHTFYEYS